MATKINSKAKGSRNERELCKWWKSWTGKEFSRVPSSGGLRWARTADTTGDIICSDNKHFLRFPFSIETKAYSDINFEHLLTDNKNIKILEFWDQAVADSKRANKIPVLMMRYNGMKKGEYFFIISSNILQIFEEHSEIELSGLIAKTNRANLAILKASEVLENVDYGKVFHSLRKILRAKKKSEI